MHRRQRIDEHATPFWRNDRGRPTTLLSAPDLLKAIGDDAGASTNT
ncbi:MAG: hypothetical protein ABI393_09755 [Paralcaligenes sp.]